MNTRYAGAACRSMTSPRLTAARRPPPSPRSGPDFSAVARPESRASCRRVGDAPRSSRRARSAASTRVARRSTQRIEIHRHRSDTSARRRGRRRRRGCRTAARDCRSARALTVASIDDAARARAAAPRRRRRGTTPRLCSRRSRGQRLEQLPWMPPNPPFDISTTTSPARCSRDDGADDVVDVGDVAGALPCARAGRRRARSADSRSASGSDERKTAAMITSSAAPNARRSRPETRAGTTRPSAARTPPRCAAPG